MDTILSGKLSVYYLDDSRRKQIRWTGTALKSDVQKLIDVYSACEDLMTLPSQQDDGLIFSAETPGEYTIGKIDAGEIDPWFIDMKTMEHMIGDYKNFTGCALKTSGWTRVQDSNTGIVVVTVTHATNNIVVGDIGQLISHGDGDSGTLLDVIITGGTNDYLWIRPDSHDSTDNWDSTSGTITEAGTSHTAVQAAAALTGEMVWGNAYTQGALLPDTHILIYQAGERVTSVDETDQDWWVDGHVDRAFPITDYTTDAFPIIDNGYLLIKANQYGSKYTYSIIRMNSTSGGNVSAGLSSGADGYNTTGYASITISGGSGNWTVGDEIEGKVSGARAIITQITSPGATAVLHFYYIGDPLIVFDGSEGIQNNDDTGDASGSSAVSDQGPALTSWFDGSAFPTYAFANTQVDIDDNGTDEEYGITIDLNLCSLAQMHEYNKYVTRRGSVYDLDGLDGQEWIGLDYAINYATITGTIPEGSVVVGATSGATGTIVSNPGGSSNVALLRNSRGTFVNGERIYETDGVNEFDASGLTVTVIVPVAEATFGTLAGTTFFGSRGVVLTDYKPAEENSFSLISANGLPYARPTSISMEILNLRQYDWASCFRLTGSLGSINKEEFACAGGEAAGDTTLDADSAIPADVPGKTLGGVLVLVDNSDDNQEYVIRYSSYVAATGVFTLANVDIASLTSGDVNTLNEVGAFANAKVGDLVYNHDLDEVSYISVLTSDDSVEIYPPFSGDPSGDHIELNCVPVITTSSDKIYVPIIFQYMTANGSASASMQYVSTIYSRVRVRNTSDATIKIKGFTADVTIGTTGGVSSATRIENTVYGG